VRKRAAKNQWNKLRGRHHDYDIRGHHGTQLRGAEKDTQTLFKIGRQPRGDFCSDKYNLIHLTKIFKYFNMAAAVRIGDQKIIPKKAIRILKVQVDQRLKFDKYINYLQGQMAAAERALIKFSGFTWGIGMLDTKKVYKIIVRVQLGYTTQVWHAPSQIEKENKARR
jgi:hypothetical protein